MNTAYLMNRRRFTLTVGATLTSSLVSTNAQSNNLIDKARALLGQTPTLRIALFDVSASPAPSDPTSLYVSASKRFFGQANAGDQCLLVAVGEHGMDRIRPFSLAIPRSGKAFEDKRNLKTAHETVSIWVEKTIGNGRSDTKSRYIETLAALRASVKRSFAIGANVDILILGDGLENSEISNFEKPFEPTQVLKSVMQRDTLLVQEKAKSGLQMMFIGAGGTSQPVFQKTEQFWMGYAEACGANMVYYGSSMPPFWG